MNKQGFTLIELMVVIAIVSVLLLVAANFLIFSIQQDNQATIENAVRNEGNFISETLSRDIRLSSCEIIKFNSIKLFNSSDCSGEPYADYRVNGDGVLLRNNIPLNSTFVRVEYCSSCSCGEALPGLTVATPTPPSLSKRIYYITLSLRQNSVSSRSDFCGKIQLEFVAKPRNNN